MKPSGYVTNLIDPIRALKVNHAGNASKEQILEWSLAISESISDKWVKTFFQKLQSKRCKRNCNNLSALFRFYNVTSDVLTSIKRTEDSLLRLKRIKKSDNSSTNPVTTEKGKMTDDDKIRLQFALDAEEFGKQVMSNTWVGKILG